MQSLLQLHPSSISSERIWSDFDFIHSKRRNKLKNCRVRKLVAVRKNLQQTGKNAKSKLNLEKTIEYYCNVKPVALRVNFDEDDVLFGLGGGGEGETLSANSDSDCDSDSDVCDEDLTTDSECDI